MSWFEEEAKKTIYQYKSADGDVISGTLLDLSAEYGKELVGEYQETFNHNGTDYVYAGFQPKKNTIMTKIVFEKNGRKAIRIQHSDGKSHVRSMTKENLLKGKGSKSTETRYDHKGNAKGRGTEVSSVLSKDFKQYTDKIKENQVQQSLKNMKKVIAQSNSRSKK